MIDISGIWKDKPTTIGSVAVAVGLTVAVGMGWVTAEAAMGIQAVLLAALGSLLNTKKGQNESTLGPGVKEE